VFEPIKSPLVQAAVQAADLDFRRDGTPERVEFENSIADETAKEDQLSEIDEDEWTDHNFGNSVHSGTEDEASSLDDSRYILSCPPLNFGVVINLSDLVSSSDDDEDDEEGGEEVSNENLMELDRPLTADETRRLAESWKKRYSTEASDRNPQECQEPLHESIPESTFRFRSYMHRINIDNWLSLDEEENNVRIDVPAFPLASEPIHKKSSEEATSSDTEV
jgi:hypothetical protein